MRLQVQRETNLFEQDSAHDNALMGRWLGKAAIIQAQDHGIPIADDFIQSAVRPEEAVRVRRVAASQAAGSVQVPNADPGSSYRIDPGRPGDPGGGTIFTYVPLSPELGDLELAASLAAQR